MVNIQKLLDKKYSDKENTKKIDLGKEIIILSSLYSSLKTREISENLVINGYPNVEEIFLDNVQQDSKWKINKLEIKDCLKIRFLACSNHLLTSLDTSELPELEVIWCSRNKITSLNLIKNNKLLDVDCHDNLLSKLDISKCAWLIKLDCNNNKLENLNIINNLRLSKLDCSNNQLTNVIFSSNYQKFESINLNNNKLDYNKIDKNFYNHLPSEFDVQAPLRNHEKLKKIIKERSGFLERIHKIEIFETWWNPNCAILISKGLWYEVTIIVYEPPIKQTKENLKIIKVSNHFTLEKAQTKSEELKLELNGDNPILAIYTDTGFSPQKVMVKVDLPEEARQVPDEYLRPFDMVWRRGEKSGKSTPTYHVAIYLGNKRVVHISGSKMLSKVTNRKIKFGTKSFWARNDSWEEFLKENKDPLIRHHLIVPFKRPEKILEHIRKAIAANYGKNEYSMLSKNCEHFAALCVCSIAFSEQADKIKFLFENINLKLEMKKNEKMFEQMASYDEIIEKLEKNKECLWKEIQGYCSNLSPNLKTTFLEFMWETKKGNISDEALEKSLKQANELIKLGLNEIYELFSNDEISDLGEEEKDNFIIDPRGFWNVSYELLNSEKQLRELKKQRCKKEKLSKTKGEQLSITEKQKVKNLSKKLDWFSEKRWLTAQEIDWAWTNFQQLLTQNQQELQKKLQWDIVREDWETQELLESQALLLKKVIDKHNLLSAHTFHCLQEKVNGSKIQEKQLHLSFSELLAELDENKYEVICIPVESSNCHWSLLVYKTKEKKFYHFDNLSGTNYECIKPLVKNILIAKGVPVDEWQKHLVTKHEIDQGNSYDCGIAVIAIGKDIIQSEWCYISSSLTDVELPTYDFSDFRKGLKEILNQEIAQEVTWLIEKLKEEQDSIKKNQSLSLLKQDKRIIKEMIKQITAVKEWTSGFVDIYLDRFDGQKHKKYLENITKDMTKIVELENFLHSLCEIEEGEDELELKELNSKVKNKAEKDWTHIELSFKNNPKLVEEWKKRDFDYEQTKEWIDIGLKAEEADYAQWLRNIKKVDSDWVLNEGDDRKLRQEFLQWFHEERLQSNIEVSPKINKNHD